MWNIDPDTHRSVRSPAFFGPVMLSAALITVSLLSDPLWRQFHLIEATAMNTTMTIGEWGACTALRNTTNVTGDTVFCSSAMSGFNVYVNLNSSMFYNFATEKDNGLILGSTQPAGTTESIQVVTSGQTGLAWIHVLAALVAILTVISLAIPPRWISGGKSRLANIQRSGMLTLALAGVSFILTIVDFAILFSITQTIKAKMNAIDGIHATWSGTAVFWFLLPSAIIYIPPFLVVLLPSYVRPADRDDDESAPMAPLVAPQLNQSHYNKSVESFGSSNRTGYGADSPFPKVPSMYANSPKQ